MLLYVPSSHGSAADAPSAQYDPGVHASHAVSPASSWKVPAAHLPQVLMLTLGATVPGLHFVGAREPVEQNEPAGHSMQSRSDVIEMLSSSIVAF